MITTDSTRLEVAFESMLEEANAASDKNQSYLAQLMTIWASGYLEARCREVIGTYTTRRAQPNIAKYVRHDLDRFSNPKMGKIIELVRRFDKNVSDELESFAEGQIREGIDSIVSNRHKIAHGRPSQISIAAITRYFHDAREFARKMEALLLH